MTHTFRILTLNVWNVFGPWERRRRELVRWFSELQPDAACLQEVRRGPDADQLAEIVAELAAEGARFHGTFAGVPYDAGEIGNATLTRTPPERSHVVPLPGGDPEEPARTLLCVKAGPAWVMTTHLSPRPHQAPARREQVAAIRDAIGTLAAEEPGAAFLLAGDLNAPPEAPEVTELLEPVAGLRPVDAWTAGNPTEPGRTWDNDGNPFTEGQGMPDGRVDYVIVAGDCEVRRARIVCDRPLTGVHASDHYGVLAEVAGS